MDKPVCKLVGTNGNVFAIIGNVSATLKRVGQHGQAKEFVARAMDSDSYEDVLCLCSEYVEVQ